MPRGAAQTLLAVIVPVRGTGDWRETIRSLAAGRRVPDELVVVDDGSEPPLWGAEGVNFPGLKSVHFIRTPPLGPAAARNTGAEAAQSPILVFIDSDVSVAPDTLGLLEERLLNAPSDVAAVQAVYSELTEVGSFATEFQNLLQRYNFLSVKDDEHFTGLSSYCIAVRRTAMEAVGGFDTTVGRPTVEDDTFGLELVRSGWRVVLARDITVRHRARYRVTTLVRRMCFMAADKIRSIRRKPWVGRMSISQSHHRPEFLLSTVGMLIACITLGFAPGLSLIAVLSAAFCQATFLRSAYQQGGLLFASRALVMILLLAASAAVGCIIGAAS